MCDWRLLPTCIWPAFDWNVTVPIVSAGLCCSCCSALLLLRTEIINLFFLNKPLSFRTLYYYCKLTGYGMMSKLLCLANTGMLYKRQKNRRSQLRHCHAVTYQQRKPAFWTSELRGTLVILNAGRCSNPGKVKRFLCSPKVHTGSVTHAV